jgi:hypothetical protein
VPTAWLFVFLRVVSNETLWAKWIQRTRPLPGGGAEHFTVQGAKYNEGIYFDNYYGILVLMPGGVRGKRIRGA